MRPGDSYRRSLQGLLTDVEMLLSLYDNTMKFYNWYIHETQSDNKLELASEQLEEARQSKATAINLGKVSNPALLYLPLNFVCTMLGMNLSIFGQGNVPVWVFSRLGGMLQSPDILPHVPSYSRPTKSSALEVGVLPDMALYSCGILVSRVFGDP